MAFTKEQIKSFNALDIETRFNKTLDLVKQDKKVVILSDKGGFVTMTLDDAGEEVVIPVWPDVNLAQECANGEWEGAKPDIFELDEWVTFILPELADDGIMIAVAATKEDDGFILSAKSFGEEITGDTE